MLEPLLCTSGHEQTICQRIIEDIHTNKMHRPLGKELTKETIFGSFSRRGENEYYIRYQLPTERGYKGVELKYLVEGEKLIYQGDTMDWELKR
jgi:hypothetical protein